MRGNPLRNLLIRFIWDPGINARDYSIVFRSRGAEGGVEVVKASNIVKVYLRGFEVRTELGVKYIPFHRVLLVRNEATGELLYRSRSALPHSE